MTPTWERLQQLFEEARGMAPEARAAYLQRTCGGNAALRAEVESLLAHDAEAEKGFLTY